MGNIKIEKKYLNPEKSSKKRLMLCLFINAGIMIFAIEDGNGERLNEMIPDNLPEEIKIIYEDAHLDKKKELPSFILSGSS